MQKEFHIVVDIGKKVLTPIFEVNTNDLKSVKLVITITHGLILLDLTDTIVRIAIKKPDNTIVFQDCMVKDAKKGLAEVVLENQAYIKPGNHIAEVMCYKNQEVVAVSGTFSYRAITGILNDKSVESKTELTAISKQLKEVEDTIEDLRKNGTGIDGQARQDIEEVATQLEDIKYYPYENGSVFSFVDDDASKAIMGNVKTVCDQKGIKMSFAAMGYYLDHEGENEFYASVDQLTQLKNEGHDIVNHSYSRELHTITSDNDLENELLAAKDAMKRHGFDTDVIVYPTGINADGINDIRVKKFVRKYFKYGVNAWGKTQNPVDNYYIGREDFNARTLEELKAIVDKAVQEKTWVVFMTHCWMDTFDPVKFANLIDYIKSKSVPIMTFSEASKYKGNAFSYGEYTRQGFAVSSNGFVSSNWRNPDVSEWNRSAFDYAQNGTSVENFPHWVEGMPIYPGTTSVGWARYGGDLITFRGNNDIYTRQIFYQHNSIYPALFSRNWNTETKNWNQWEPFTKSNHIGTQNGADYENAPPSTYPQNSVITMQINQGSWSLLNGKGGTLVNYRSQDDAYSYQEFTPYDQAIKYKRMWNNGTKTWEPLQAYV